MEKAITTLDQTKYHDKCFYGNKPIIWTEKYPENVSLIFDALQKQGIFPYIPQEMPLVTHGEDGLVFLPTIIDNRLLYIAARTIEAKGGKPRENQLVHFEQGDFQLLSGLCLFGGMHASGLTANGEAYSLIHKQTLDTLIDSGEVIEEIAIDQRIHPNEIDSILKLLPVINRFADKFPVTLHLPRIEYYFYALELYKAGAMTKDALITWFGAVEARCEKVISMIDNRIKGDYILGEPLSSLGSVLKNNPDITLDEVFGILSKDPLWLNLLSQKPPETFTELGFLSYAYEYLSLLEKGGQVLAIEDPGEERILFQVKKHMKKTLSHEATLIALYVHPAAVVTEDEIIPGSRRILYYYDDSKHTSAERLGNIRSIVSHHRRNKYYVK